MAKTANLLVDGLGRGPGDRLALLLPVHWQAVVVALAGWWAGLTVQVGRDVAAADVVVTGEPDLASAMASGADVVGLSLAALGRPLARVPAGVVDYASEVLGYADAAPVGPSPRPALTVSAASYDVAAVLAGPHIPSAVLLTTAPLTDLASLRACVTGPLASGGRVVLCRHLDPAHLERRRSAERVTADFGLEASRAKQPDES